MGSASSKTIAIPDLSRIQRANRLQCLLFRLPPELRNEIYYYVFHEPPVKVYSEWVLFRSLYMIPLGSVALLQTWPQTRREARDFFLSTTTFDLHLSCTMEKFLLGSKDIDVSLVTSIICDLSVAHGCASRTAELSRAGCEGKMLALDRLHIVGTDNLWAARRCVDVWRMIHFVTDRSALTYGVKVTWSMTKDRA